MNINNYVVTMALVITAMLSSAALAQSGTTNFNSSLSNFENSPMNFNNSPMNFENSPMNFENSPMNFNATNGVFDSQGNRTGYTTVSPDGVTNIFNQDGTRSGYIPAPVQEKLPPWKQ
jgi:hypothetical protein